MFDYVVLSMKRKPYFECNVNPKWCTTLEGVFDCFVIWKVCSCKSKVLIEDGYKSHCCRHCAPSRRYKIFLTKWLGPSKLLVLRFICRLTPVDFNLTGEASCDKKKTSNVLEAAKNRQFVYRFSAL